MLRLGRGTSTRACRLEVRAAFVTVPLVLDERLDEGRIILTAEEHHVGGALSHRLQDLGEVLVALSRELA